jgi:hypothetical protein
MGADHHTVAKSNGAFGGIEHRSRFHFDIRSQGDQSVPEHVTARKFIDGIPGMEAGDVTAQLLGVLIHQIPGSRQETTAQLHWFGARQEPGMEEILGPGVRGIGREDPAHYLSL